MERRVLHGLRERMLDPGLIGAFVRQYNAEYGRRTRAAMREREKLHREHREAAARVTRLIEAIAGGGDSFADVREMLSAATAQRDRLADEILAIDADPVVTLHPGIADEYRRQIADLKAALQGDESARLAATPILRSLLDSVEMVPAETGRGSISRRMAAFTRLSRLRPARRLQKKLRCRASG